MIFKIIKFKKLSSTQDKAKELAGKGAKEGLVVVSEVMAKGRGRLNRKWSANKGGLYFSFLLRPKKTNELPFLVFKSAIAVCDAVRKFGLNVSLKWPNDILFNNKKLCGILLEASIASKVDYAIIGIGVNVSNKLPKELSGIATSIKKELNNNISKDKLLREILKQFNKTMAFYPAKTISEWKKRNCVLGREVNVKTFKEEIRGVAAGVDSDCSLIVELRNGKRKKIRVGDVGLV